MDHRDNFDKWVTQWEDAQKSGIFPEDSKPEPQNGEDFFGNWNQNKDNGLQDVDAEYWRKVYQLSNNSGDAPDILNEDTPVETKELAKTTKPDGKSVSKITDELGGLANPVPNEYRGKDKYDKVTPNWAGGEDLIELHKLKENLHKLEDKLATDPMLEDKKSKSLLAQIKSIKDKIDELSDSIAPEFRTEYLS